MFKSLVVSKVSVLFIALSMLGLHITKSTLVEAKVRPADINHPTDHNGLGRGYAPPGALFSFDIWGGVGGTSDPYILRSQSGFFFNSRSPFEAGELGLSWGMFNHSYEDSNETESGTYTTNLVVDWRWRGGKRSLHDPYFGIGVALPTRKLSGEGGFEGEAQLDAFQIALASRFGGQKRWIWEPNSASAFFESGGRTNWGSFIVEGELAGAYLYRVANSTVIESANLFVQANGALGFQGKKSTFLLGGGYGIAPLSFAEDVDQIHAKLSYSYLREKNEYFINLFVPIDAPAGLLGNQVGLNLVLGIQGQM